MATNKEKLLRLIVVDQELHAVRALYSDFKTVHAAKLTLRQELRQLINELREEYEQLTDELGGKA